MSSDGSQRVQIEDFRAGQGLSDKLKVTQLTPVPLVPAKQILIPDGKAFDISKIFDNSILGGQFSKSMSAVDQNGMYSKMYNIFSDDFSLKGINLLQKAHTRDRFLKTCFELDSTMASRFGYNFNLEGYGLLALLAALACNGINNLISGVLDEFAGMVSPQAIAAIVPKLFEIHDGEDAIGLLEDVALSEAGRYLPMVSGNVLGEVVSLVDKETGNQDPNDLGSSVFRSLAVLAPQWGASRVSDETPRTNKSFPKLVVTDPVSAIRTKATVDDRVLTQEEMFDLQVLENQQAVDLALGDGQLQPTEDDLAQYELDKAEYVRDDLSRGVQHDISFVGEGQFRKFTKATVTTSVPTITKANEPTPLLNINETITMFA